MSQIATPANFRFRWYVRLLFWLQQYFSGNAIIELTALIAYQNMSSKFNVALGIPAQGFCAPAWAMRVRS